MRNELYKIGTCFENEIDTTTYTIVKVDDKLMIKMDHPASGIHFYKLNWINLSNLTRLEDEKENINYTLKEAIRIDLNLKPFKDHKRFVCNEECSNIENKILNRQEKYYNF